ncbi:hypothetical protein AVEN_158136-1 [Araneus ventricosus]|uniref:Uncharacterized protein n=1 Tax=Araneus ventricosus TaxID=182803 RepID=A0A4Y2Q2S0_ARAVE|nr:hypothetical protein AVEN_158136-1 [Araneus ventricosus]
MGYQDRLVDELRRRAICKLYGGQIEKELIRWLRVFRMVGIMIKEPIPSCRYDHQEGRSRSPKNYDNYRWHRHVALNARRHRDLMMKNSFGTLILSLK